MRRLLVALAILAALGVATQGNLPCEVWGVQPSCYVALKPGPTENTLDLVVLDGAVVYGSNGELLLTTVAVDDKLGLRGWITTTLSRTEAIVPREHIYPPEQEREDVTRQNAALMVDSQLTAAVAALRAAGYDVDEEFDGARIAALMDTVVTDALEAGDVVIAVDGQPVTDNRAIVDAVRERRPGDRLVLTIRRDGEEEDVEVILGSAPDDPQRPWIGVELTSHLDLPVDVEIDAGIIGGPSAGLMFALSIVDQLASEDLTGGRIVAGTGTLDRDGTIGAVGGVRQKLAGATARTDGQRPAGVFLVPRGNLPEAQGATVARDLLLVPVATLDDALDALADLRDGRRPDGALALQGRGTD